MRLSRCRKRRRWWQIVRPSFRNCMTTNLSNFHFRRWKRSVITLINRRTLPKKSRRQIRQVQYIWASGYAQLSPTMKCKCYRRKILERWKIRIKCSWRMEIIRGPSRMIRTIRPRGRIKIRRRCWNRHQRNTGHHTRRCMFVNQMFKC